MALDEIKQQALQLWSKLSLGKRIVLGAIVAAVLGVLVLVSTRQPEERYGILFAQLPPGDAAEVVKKLEADKIPYRLEESGKVIKVPEARVDQLRLSMVSAGVPKGGGAGFELFDRQSYGTTNFAEQLNYERALSGELARTISSLEAVESARVHLNLPRPKLYTKDAQPPSVSVAIRLRPGQGLTKKQIEGVVGLVQGSVERLERDAITLIDEAGHILWGPHHDEDEADEAPERELERKLQGRVMSMLDRLVGPGQSVAVVTAELERRREERTEELYDNPKLVLRSEQSTTESKAGANVGGVAGVRGNVPAADGSLPTPATVSEVNNTTVTAATKNYEVSKVVRRQQWADYPIKRIHVAVLLNAQLAETSTVGLVMPPRSPEFASAPTVTAKDLERVAALVREAGGLELDRGDRLELHALPFAGTERLAELPTQSSSVAATIFGVPTWVPLAGAGVLVVLLAGMTLLFLAWRRKSKQAAEALLQPVRAAELEAALEANKEPSPTLQELQARVRELAKSDVALAAQILEAWLRRETGKSAP